MTSFAPVRSVERTFLVLSELNRQPISRVQDLERETGLPAPTLVRILETLCALGYVQKNGRRAGYTLTEKVRELSSGFHGLPRFIEDAKPVLDELTKTLLWPAALATLDGEAMVVRVSTIPDSPLSHTHSTLQKRLDLLTRAHGQAYLAFCSAIERDHLFKLLCQTQVSRMQPGELAAHMDPILTRIRYLGYAERDHEIDPQTTTLAMPVRSGAAVIATMGITFFRGANPNRTALIEKLDTAVERVENLIGQAGT
ncbi:MAG: DNA-binding transcriptional regulator [Pikeienuella sp.]